MKENTYEVLDNGFNKVLTESEALEILKEAAEEIYTFTLLTPEECSKIKLIKRLDNLQEDLVITIRPYDKKTNLSLIIKDGKVSALVNCAVTSRVLRILTKSEKKKEIKDMNEAEVRRIVNEKISEVLEGLYDALYYASAQVDPEMGFEVLRENIEEINKRINNG